MQCFDRTNDNAAFNVYDMDEDLKNDTKITKILNKLAFMCAPNSFPILSDAYNRNSVEMLMGHVPDIQLQWPKPNIPVISPIPKIEDTITFYKNLSDQMVTQYTKYLIQSDIIKSYDDIVNNAENYIDLTKTLNQCDSTDDLYSDSPTIARTILIDKHTMNVMKLKYDWYCFCPPFSTMTIRTNKMSYLYINIQELDEAKQFMRMIIDLYAGNRISWIRKSSTEITIQFKPENNTTSCEFNPIRSESYEEILTNHVKQMHWSNRHIQFWYDVLGIDRIDKMGIAHMKYRTSTETDQLHNYTTILKNIDETRNLTKCLDIQLETIARNKDFLDYLHKDTNTYLFMLYMRTIASLNYELFTQPKTQVSDNEYKFNDVSIRSKNNPVIPSQNHTIKIQKRIS